MPMSLSEAMRLRAELAKRRQALREYEAETNRLRALQMQQPEIAPKPEIDPFKQWAARYGQEAMNEAYMRNVLPGLLRNTNTASLPVNTSSGIQRMTLETAGRYKPLGENPQLSRLSDGTLPNPIEERKKRLGLKEGGIVERIRNTLVVKKTPQEKANMAADQLGGMSGQAVYELRNRRKRIEEELARQGLRRGVIKVVDPTGKGHPKKDTVPAKLAEGEAVLNAGAAEILGRKNIEKLNQKGAEMLGLRCGAKHVKGVLHAAQGTSYVSKFKEELKKQLRPGTGSGVTKKVILKTLPIAAKATVPTAVVAEGLDTLSDIQAVPEEKRGEYALRRVGEGGLRIGGAVLGAKLGTAAGAATGIPYLAALGGLAGGATGFFAPNLFKNTADKEADRYRITHPKPVTQPAAQPATQPAPVVLSPAEQIRQADEAALNKFFAQYGIDRSRVPTYQQGEFGKKGLRVGRLDVPGSSSEIYRIGKNQYVGMGRPSQAIADMMVFNTPEAEQARLRNRLMNEALAGNKQAADILNTMVASDARIAEAGLRQAGKTDTDAAKLNKEVIDRVDKMFSGAFIRYDKKGEPKEDKQAENLAKRIAFEAIARSGIDPEQFLNSKEFAQLYNDLITASDMSRVWNEYVSKNADITLKGLRNPTYYTPNLKIAEAGKGRYSLWDVLTPFDVPGLVETDEKGNVISAIPIERLREAGMDETELQRLIESLQQSGKIARNLSSLNK